MALIFRYLSVKSEKAKAICDSFIAQAKCNPMGAKPTLFKYRLPKSLIPLLNIPPMAWTKNMIMRAIRRNDRLFVNLLFRKLIFTPILTKYYSLYNEFVIEIIPELKAVPVPVATSLPPTKVFSVAFWRVCPP